MVMLCSSCVQPPADIPNAPQKQAQAVVFDIDGTLTQRAVMDVRDCVRAYYLLMKNKCSGVYNVCSASCHAMEYYTDLLIKYSELSVEKVVHPPFYKPIDIQVQIGNTSKLSEATGWHPEIDIHETLNDLLDYWIKKLI